jgi:hypothetical protein
MVLLSVDYQKANDLTLSTMCMQESILDMIFFTTSYMHDM